MASPNSTANNFTITFDGAEAAGQTINFAMFSLLPPTFNNRENGMRINISTVRDDIGALWCDGLPIDDLKGVV